MLTVDLGKNRKQIGESRIGNELFDSVKEVAGSVFGKGCGSPGTQWITAAVRFGQAISTDPLSTGQFPQVLLLLFCGAVIN